MVLAGLDVGLQNNQGSQAVVHVPAVPVARWALGRLASILFAGERNRPGFRGQQHFVVVYFLPPLLVFPLSPLPLSCVDCIELCGSTRTTPPSGYKPSNTLILPLVPGGEFCCCRHIELFVLIVWSSLREYIPNASIHGYKPSNMLILPLAPNGVVLLLSLCILSCLC